MKQKPGSARVQHTHIYIYMLIFIYIHVGTHVSKEEEWLSEWLIAFKSPIGAQANTGRLCPLAVAGLYQLRVPRWPQQLRSRQKVSVAAGQYGHPMTARP